jgi:hypothetical protein
MADFVDESVMGDAILGAHGLTDYTAGEAGGALGKKMAVPSG